jgi:hypothetical protein
LRSAGSWAPTEASVAAERRRPRFDPRAAIAAILIVAIIGLAIWYLARFEPLLVRGEAESTRVDIAARVSGRLAKIEVHRGQNVMAGATLLVIDNPELVALLHQDEAEKAVADAELQRIRVGGTRAEIIAQREAEIDRASADSTFAQHTYNRTKQLAADKFATQSKLDEDTDALILAQRRLDQAKLAHEEAVRGFTAEEHQIAEANVARAAAKVETTKALVDQLRMTPIASQVYQIPAEEGGSCYPRTAIDIAGRSRRYLARLFAAQRPDCRAETGRPVHGQDPGARQPPGHGGGSGDRVEGRICRVARDPGDRRFRSAHLCNPRLSGRQRRRPASRDERLYRLEKKKTMKPPPPPSLGLVALREIRFFSALSRRL